MESTGSLKSSRPKEKDTLEDMDSVLKPTSGITIRKPNSLDKRKLYEFQPLKEADEFRILKVEKKLLGGLWDYTILHRKLNKTQVEASKHPYEPASWVWGDPERRHMLELSDGTLLPINDNMQEALPYLSKRCRTGYLWIDQLCIDQSNVKERGHQVKIMGSIYARCGARCLVWLGLPSLEHERTLRALFEWQELKSDYKPPDDDQLAALGWLCDRPWFLRAWIIQEVVLPPDSVVLCGCASARFNTIYSLSRRALEEQPTLNPEAMSLLAIVDRMRLGLKGTCPSWSFTKILDRLSHRVHSSDSRDLVYAFLGLHCRHVPRLEPDYSKSLADVLVEVTVEMIRESSSLYILNFLNRSRDPSSTMTLPSWVPDWTSPPSCRLIFPLECERFAPNVPYAQYYRARTWWSSAFDVRFQRVEGHLAGLRVKATPLERILLVYDDTIRAYNRVKARPFERNLEDFDNLLKEARDFLIAFLFHNSAAFSPEQFHDENDADIDDALFTCQAHHMGLEEFGREVLYKRRVSEYAAFHRETMKGRQMFKTSTGLLGCAEKPRAGDAIYFIHGCNEPVILRLVKEGVFRVVETCFVLHSAGNPMEGIDDAGSAAALMRRHVQALKYDDYARENRERGGVASEEIVLV